MKKLKLMLAVLLLSAVSIPGYSAPSVFPTGTTIYDPEKAWNGYTVLSVLGTRGVVLIDMNGRVVKQWDNFNVSAGGPARILPGGQVVASNGSRRGHQESLELVQRDFSGNDIWSFRKNEQIENEDGEMIWSARQHHDWQRDDFPAGYYSPKATPALEGSRTLLLTHTNLTNSKITDKTLTDDRIIEVSWDGEIIWEWRASDHADEFQFDLDEWSAIRKAPVSGFQRNGFDWMHINSATYVGPNKWYDQGDKRFAPENVIISSRQSSVVAIIDRSGSVVWQIGPDFSRTKEQQEIRQIIGQHHAHFIPKGLPGAGNVLIFDNGGSGGYGVPSPIAPDGIGVYARSTSRIIEINPVSLELVWSYRAANFFSTNISSAQRLPNGNTLITEGAPGRIFEVTSQGDIIWEYMSPPAKFPGRSNPVYRAYRLPYSWIPQLAKTAEIPVVPPDPWDFVMP